MAIKNIFARGVGFCSGVVGWVVTRGFGSLTPPLPPTYTVAGDVDAIEELSLSVDVIE